MKFRKAQWREFPRATYSLFEAVALSFGIEPGDQNLVDAMGLGRLVTFKNTKTGKIIRLDTSKSQTVDVSLSELKDRLKIAIEETPPEVQPRRPYPSPTAHSDYTPVDASTAVTLTAFANLADDLGWKVTDRFPKPQRRVSPDVYAGVPGKTERRNLHRMIAALVGKERLESLSKMTAAAADIESKLQAMELTGPTQTTILNCLKLAAILTKSRDEGDLAGKPSRPDLLTIIAALVDVESFENPTRQSDRIERDLERMKITDGPKSRQMQTILKRVASLLGVKVRK
jgi:hypothetical protein